MTNQTGLFPISTEEFELTSFRLAALMDERADAVEVFDETKASHKEHLKALEKEMAECKRRIRLYERQGQEDRA